MGDTPVSPDRAKEREAAQITLDVLYAAAKKNWPSFEERAGQRLMMQTLLQVMLNYKTGEEARDGSNLGIVEGKTGSGKTVGYMLPALAVAHATGRQIVISTATVALQEQLYGRDLPNLAKVASALGMSVVPALLKGRNRYVCQSKLEGQLEVDPEAPAPKSASSDAQRVQVFGRMRDALERRTWSGDRDEWADQLPDDQWQQVQADRGTCPTRKCPHYNECGFFKARSRARDANIIVANHALVLSALATEANLIDPEETIFVFDEGHHLKDIGVDHFASQFMVRATARTIARMTAATLKGVKVIDSEHMTSQLPAIKQAVQEIGGYLRTIHTDLSEHPALTSGQHLRFKRGQVPVQLSEVLSQLSSRINDVKEFAFSVASILRDRSGGADPVLTKQVGRLLADIGPGLIRLGDVAKVCKAWGHAGAVPKAKWVELSGQAENPDVKLCASALTAAADLSANLWRKVSAAAVTSATLTACGSFEFFAKMTGLARFPSRVEMETESPFNYAKQGELRVARMSVDPKSPAAFLQELQAAMPQRLAKERSGQLAIFTSRRQMEAVYHSLPDKLRARVLLQGKLPRVQLLKEHARRIAAGESSIIFGLDSFGEGIDLPGALCENVYIDKLPFAPPDSPAEEALAEWLEDQKRDPFMEITVPKAAQKLAQWVGRGIRTERDWARITIFDPRLVTKGYGAKLLEGLPPLPLVNERVGVGR